LKAAVLEQNFTPPYLYFVDIKFGFRPKYLSSFLWTLKFNSTLITSAKKNNQLVICSIFVNPTQFNKAEDLEKYPRKEKEDILLLESFECDYLFMPTTDEIYKNYNFPGIELNELEHVMEGKFRPGHFQGVCQIVYRLFDLVKPTKAYFGLKDFQQVAVIKYMTSFFKLPIEIVACPTIREENGLALSSRNKNLSIQGIGKASLIYHYVQNHIKLSQFKNEDPRQIESGFKEFLLSNGFDSVDYITIASPNTLEPVSDFTSPSRIFIAIFLEGVRLIDNFDLL
jgi:pantoate--beta-alanine ligase